MTEDRIRTGVLRALHRVAPEADLGALDEHRDLRDQLDIDSIGILQFAAGIEAELGVAVPERDYPQLVTLDSALAYLGRTAAAR